MTVDQVVVVGLAATLEWRNLDQDGESVEPAGTVTVGVTRADGTAVLSAGTTTTTVSDETGLRRVSLTAAQNNQLDRLTATWTDAGDGSAHTTTVDVIGGHLFTLPEARASDTEIGDRFTVAELIDARWAVTEEVEWICDRAFTPRFTTATVSGTGDRELWLPSNDRGSANDLRTVESVAVDGTAYTSGQLAQLATADDRVIYAADGDFWDFGVRNIAVGWTYGMSRPPRSLQRAALRRLRHVLNAQRSGVPDRATSFTVAEGGTFRLDTASRYKTGIPDVDSHYGRWSKRSNGEDGHSPASRQLDLDPQYGSLFHGGRR